MKLEIPLKNSWINIFYLLKQYKMERRYSFDFNTLNSYITENQKKIDREDWELTMLRDNYKSHLFVVLDNPQKCVVTIDEDNWEIKFDGNSEQLKDFELISSWFDIDKKMWVYRQIKYAMEEAKESWIFDKIFKEIKEE